jgi:hypothetical protein
VSFISAPHCALNDGNDKQMQEADSDHLAQTKKPPTVGDMTVAMEPAMELMIISNASSSPS